MQGPDLVRLGLAMECVDDDMVVERCHEIAKRIASFPVGASSTVKSSIVGQRGVSDVEAFFSKGGASTALLTAGKVQ